MNHRIVFQDEGTVSPVHLTSSDEETKTILPCSFPFQEDLKMEDEYVCNWVPGMVRLPFIMRNYPKEAEKNLNLEC